MLADTYWLNIGYTCDAAFFSWRLKVSKSRKQKYFFSILPKNEQKGFALVGRSNFGKYFIRFLGELRTSSFAFENY
jgi:hypothetical protein